MEISATFLNCDCDRSLTALKRVNNTSSLQIHSLMYRFHPSVKWERGYPDRQQILSQVKQLWKRYNLDEKTVFNFKADKVYQDEKGRWVVNNPSNGRFDGLIAAVGTCGDPKRKSTATTSEGPNANTMS